MEVGTKNNTVIKKRPPASCQTAGCEPIRIFRTFLQSPVMISARSWNPVISLTISFSITIIIFLLVEPHPFSRPDVNYIGPSILKPIGFFLSMLFGVGCLLFLKICQSMVFLIWGFRFFVACIVSPSIFFMIYWLFGQMKAGYAPYKVSFLNGFFWLGIFNLKILKRNGVVG